MLSLVVPRFQVSGDALSEVEVFQVSGDALSEVEVFQVSGDALSEVEVFQVIALSPSLALSPFRPFALSPGVN